MIDGETKNVFQSGCQSLPRGPQGINDDLYMARNALRLTGLDLGTYLTAASVTRFRPPATSGMALDSTTAAEITPDFSEPRMSNKLVETGAHPTVLALRNEAARTPDGTQSPRTTSPGATSASSADGVSRRTTPLSALAETAHEKRGKITTAPASAGKGLASVPGVVLIHPPNTLGSPQAPVVSPKVSIPFATGPHMRLLQAGDLAGVGQTSSAGNAELSEGTGIFWRGSPPPNTEAGNAERRFYAPMRTNQGRENVGEASGGAARASVPPPPTPEGRGQISGDVYLDGIQVGRWIGAHLDREATKPPSGPSFFDPRLSPNWAGTPVGY
mgnify:CR=1 FL=1